MNSVIIDLSTNGDGTGTINGIGDYDGNPTSFKYTATQKTIITKFRAFIFGGTGGVELVQYAGSILFAANGVLIQVKKADGTVFPLCNPIHRNQDWIAETEQVIRNDYNAIDYFLTAEIFFERNGVSITLDKGDEFEVILQDTFDFLTHHRFKIYGRKEIEWQN